jgi:hypothetical protein
LKCFDIKTGKVVVHRTMKILPMPTRVLRLVNKWGLMPKNKEYRNKLEFLNNTNIKYNWDNGELEDSECLVENKKDLIYPDVLTEIPGVDLESDYDVKDTRAVQAVPEPTLAERAAAAAADANLDRTTGVPCKITGVDETVTAIQTKDSDSNDDSDDSNDDSDNEDDNLPQPPPLTHKYYNDSDNEDNDLLVVEDVTEYDTDDNDAIPEMSTVALEQFGRGHRKKTSPQATWLHASPERGEI